MKALILSTSLCALLLLLVVPVAEAGLDESQRAKLHPTFQLVLDEWTRNRSAAYGDALHDAIIFTSDPDAVRRVGIRVNSVYTQFVTAQVSTEQLSRLPLLEPVRFVDPGSVNQLHTEVSVPETGAPLLHGAYVDNIAFRGDNVIVVIYDTGIDWKHLDFRSTSDPTQSRILRIWDQTLTAISGESAPSGFSYGVEYTQSHINNEIDGSPAGYVREQDIHGHGTHVAGTAAGNGGALSGKFTGMAPRANLVIIKGGNGSFDEVKMIDGLTYAHTIAAAQGKPVVVNFSIGGHLGPHDGTRPYEVAIDDFSANVGHAVAVSAGNDGATSMHLSRTVSAGGTEAITFAVPTYTPNSGTENDVFLFDLWCDGNPNVSATVVSPHGVSYTRTAGQTGNGPITTDGTISLYNYTSSYNGDRTIEMFIHDAVAANPPATGTWTLSLTNNGASAVTCHGWLVARSVGGAYVTLTGGNTERTVSMPATSAAAITVGSYVTKWVWPSYTGSTYQVSGTDRTGNSSTFSSIGPTRDNRQKPDIAAPGQVIMAPLSSMVDTTGEHYYIAPGQKHWAMSGTSMAAPHVTGALALLLQSEPGLTSSQLKSLLTTTALGDAFATSLPNATWGYGKMDVFRALIRQRYPAAVVTRTLVAYDGSGSSSISSVTGTQKAGVKFVAPVAGRLTSVLLNVTNNADVAIVGTGDGILQVFSVTSGIPGAQLGSSVVFPLGWLSRATNTPLSVLSANVLLASGQEYIVVLSVANPSDAIGLRSDGLATPPSTSMWFNGSTWSLWPSGHLRIQSVITTDVAPLPVQLVDFGCSVAAIGGVTLHWRTLSEVNNYGFTVQRRLKEESAFRDVANGFIPGNGTTVEPHAYSFTDKTAAAPGMHVYRLKQQDLDGTTSYTEEIIVNVGVTDVTDGAPRQFLLAQNFPNPFNPETLLEFSVETQGRARLVVYNVLGEEVATLFDEVAEAGRFYARTFVAGQFPSGVYIARLTAGDRTGLVKMVLVR
ncbi:MAG: hypothetical protein H6Q31_354 [Bacteroidetes bacterium]|jgi:subtilisin family serine protease|nr:hypothetical protein [Bacteroidota bacterium]